MDITNLTSWDALTIRDNFLFLKVMSNKAICRQFLEKLLGITIRQLRFLQTEKTVKHGLPSKGIRLDVYVEDDTGRIYDIEMQTTDRPEDALGLRSRYYQSVLDQYALKKGKHYIRLRETFIIFICTFDPFNDGLACYTFRSRCVENPRLELKDKATRIFLNPTGVSEGMNEDIKGFLNYVNNNTAAPGLASQVAAEVSRLKASKAIQEEYMTLAMYIYDQVQKERDVLHAQGRAEGIAVGRAEGIAVGKAEGIAVGKAEGIVEGIAEKGREIALKMLMAGWPTEQIVEMTGLPVEEVMKLRNIQ